jgi:hypothetical protein
VLCARQLTGFQYHFQQCSLCTCFAAAANQVQASLRIAGEQRPVGKNNIHLGRTRGDGRGSLRDCAGR